MPVTLTTPAGSQTADRYIDALTLGPTSQIATIQFSVSNNAVLAQVARLNRAKRPMWDATEIPFIPGQWGMDDICGIRFRSAFAGKVAVVNVIGYYKDDAVPFGNAYSTPGTFLADGTFIPTGSANPPSVAGIGLEAWVASPNVPGYAGGGVTPGGGAVARLMLLEQIPSGAITGAVIGLAAAGIGPVGTAKLGLATLSGEEVATYKAVTADISASLVAGPLGIKRYPFTAPYTADGITPLWLVVAFTNGWGTDPPFTGQNSEAALSLIDPGFYRPRYLSLAAGAGNIVVGGTQAVWSASSTQILWGGVY